MRNKLGQFIKGYISKDPIKKGEHRGLKTEFKKGQIPWNKGLKGLQIAWNKGLKGFRHSGSFKKGHSIYKGVEKGWFKKGQTPWIKGRGHSKETRIKLSESHKGKPCPWNRGKNNPSWKGGRKRGHYTDWEYNEWRRKVFERDKYACWICELRGKLQAHHLKDWFNYPELRYNIEKGLTLCEFCHKTYTKFGNKKKD